MIGGSLFSGIEGFGLGLLWSGLITSIAFQVENDSFCRRVLQARFPAVDKSVINVKDAFLDNLPRCDLLFGGPPCQDLSSAGDGAVPVETRSGLVREMLRVVGELDPHVVLIENVASGARRWVCPVRGALEALGYRTAALNLGVDDCGGPHRRRRIFVLAYARGGAVRLQSGRCEGPRGTDTAEFGWGRADVANTDGTRELQQTGGERVKRRWTGDGIPMERELMPALKSKVGSRPDGFPSCVVRWPTARGAAQEVWEPPRVLAGVEERAAKLKAIGNAVSPIQAYYVGLWALNVLRLSAQQED